MADKRNNERDDRPAGKPTNEPASPWRMAEPLALAGVPAALLACAATGTDAAGGLTLFATVACVLLMLVGFERERPALRQVMPTAVLSAMAAAGRILFAPIPDVKPVSAIAIVAGATLGRRSGFVVGALAALLSNAFFGQGAWTPWQMYGWGMVGWLGGVLAERGWLADGPHLGARLSALGVASGLFYGLVLNGWYGIAYVRPLAWPGVLAAFAAGLPLDLVHGVATAGFLAAIWLPWRRQIRRVVGKYGL